MFFAFYFCIIQKIFKLSFCPANALEKPLFMDVVDMVLFVDAPVEVRMHRVMERDNARPEQVLARIRAQRRIYGSLEDMPAGTGFHILENTGSPALLRRKVDEFIDLNYRK